MTGVTVAVDACGKGVDAWRVVLTEGVERLREPFVVTLGAHLGEGSDVAGQGFSSGQLARMTLSRASS